MGFMFYENIVFNNSSINNWNTSKVTTIDNTFFGAIALINHFIIGMFHL
jgi:hypothetical protein